MPAPRTEKGSLSENEIRAAALPIKHVASRAPRPPIFDTHYFLTALTHIFTALAAIGFAVYMIVQLVYDMTPTVTTSPALRISESEFESADACLIRNETVLIASAHGAWYEYHNDGERVAAGETLASIYPSDDADTIAELIQNQKEAELLTSASKVTILNSSLTSAKASAEDGYSTLMSMLASGDIKSAVNYSDTFRQALIRYELFRGGIDGLDEVINALSSDRTRLLSRLGNVLGTVTAPSSGYYYKSCDGYEEIFDVSLVDDFSAEAFYEALNRSPATVSQDTCKLVSDPKWYIAAHIDRSGDSFYTIGNTCRVVFDDSDGCIVEMTIEKKLADESGGGTLLLLSSQTMPEELDFTRFTSVRLEKLVHNGYRIPTTAVRSYNGMTGVYTLHGGMVYFRRINILFETDDYCIVSEYSDVATDRPPTYKVLGFNSEGLLGDYKSLHELAERKGWERHVYDNGGTAIKYGTKEDYYYYLDELEEVILTGKKLYDGKALG